MNIDGQQTVAIVIPVYNEEAGVDALCQRLRTVLESQNDYRWRLIFVDDGSRDATVARLTDQQNKGLSITILRLTRNFGHQAAIKAGLDYVDADAVITMDGDLQHPPEMIPQLLSLWREGNLVVQTVRAENQVNLDPTRRMLVRWAYQAINWFAERPIPEECADFRLIDRRVLTELKKLPETNPMLRGLVAWVGFKQTTIPYEVQSRHGGVSRFTLRQLINLLAGGIFDLSRKPLKFGTATGVVLAGLGLVSWIVGLISGLFFFIIFLTVVQLLGMGLIGSYLGRAYEEVLDRPLYIISETRNFDS